MPRLTLLILICIKYTYILDKPDYSTETSKEYNCILQKNRKIKNEQQEERKPLHAMKRKK